VICRWDSFLLRRPATIAASFHSSWFPQWLVLDRQTGLSTAFSRPIACSWERRPHLLVWSFERQPGGRLQDSQLAQPPVPAQPAVPARPSVEAGHRLLHSAVELSKSWHL